MKYLSVFFLLILFCSSIHAEKVQKITIAADFWCPFNCQPGSENPGYMIELAKKIFAKHNISIEYQIVPWSRALKFCRIGEISAVVGSYKSDAPDFIYPKIEQGMIGFSFFNLKGSNWHYQGLDSLENQLVGVANDYAYTDYFDSYINKNRGNSNRLYIAYGEQPLKTNIALLGRELIDTLIETEPVFLYVSKKLNNYSKFSNAGALSPALPAYIAFSPALAESKRYAEILSQGTEQLRGSGELAIILAKYGLKDWQE